MSQVARNQVATKKERKCSAASPMKGTVLGERYFSYRVGCPNFDLIFEETAPAGNEKYLVTSLAIHSARQISTERTHFIPLSLPTSNHLSFFPI